MSGYIGSKTSVTQVDGYNRTEADAEFVQDPNGAITVSGSNVGIGTGSPAGGLQISATYPTLILDETNTDAAYQQTQFSVDDGNFRLQTRTSTNTFVSNDYLMDKDANGATDHIWRIGNTERMRIDSAGRVTMPYQPAAKASYGGGNLSSSKIPLNFYSMYRGGMSIDNTNNRINVPVSGWYKIGYHHLSAATFTQVTISVNGVVADGGYTQVLPDSNSNFSVQIIQSLSANDYIEFSVTTGSVHGNQGYNSMYAHLLG